MRNQLAREQGSMFLVALITLSVLTLVGLSLAMVAETEMILGANEWAVTETHFAAEAGINVAMAQLLISNDLSPVDFVIPSYFGRLDGRNQIGFEIKSSGLLDVERGPLPLTKANYGNCNPEFTYGYTSVRSQRTAWSQGKDVPDCSDTQKNVLGQKYLMTALYFAPVECTSAEALLARDRAGADLSYSENFFCQWEIDQNNLEDNDLSLDQTNQKGTANDILSRGNPFYYGYTSGG